MKHAVPAFGRLVIAAACSVLLALAHRPALAATLEELEALFQRAMEARQAGEIDRSIELFRAIVEQRPSLGRARLELATAYAEARRIDEAIEELRRVLDDDATPEAVRRNVRDYLTLLERRRPQRSRLAFTFEGGLMYDSNASAGPGSATFPVPAGSITLAGTALKRGDWAALARLGLTHTHIAAETTPLFGEDAARLWQSGISLYTVHYSDTNRNNLDVLTLSTGPALLAPRHKLSATVQYDHLRYGTDRYADFLSFNPALTLTRDGGRTEFGIDGIVQRRDYARAVDASRDSVYMAVGGRIGRLLGDPRLTLQGGLDLFRENADATHQSNTGLEGFVGLRYRIDDRTRVHGRISQRRTAYRATDPTFGIRRKDRFDQLVLGVRHLPAAGRLAGWEVKGTVTVSRRHSSIDAYDYRRSQIAVTLGRALNL